MQKSQDGKSDIYEPGEILFQKGDPGGDLFFILDGEVEIITQHEGEVVILDIMKKGEVLGTLTCMTKEPRLAGARAKDRVALKHVPPDQIQKLIEKLPNWMRIVLKDFTNRLQRMNDLFSKAQKQIQVLEDKQISSLYTASQLAGAIAGVAEDKKISLDDKPGLIPNLILDYLEPILGVERSVLDKIFEIFLQSGMINLIIEQEKKRKYFSLANALAVRDFVAFANQARRKKIKKLLDTKFSLKEIRLIAALPRYAEAKKMDLKQTIKLPVNVLKTDLMKVTGQAFEIEPLKQAEILKLLSFEGTGEHMKVVFVTKNISNTLANLKAYGMLQKMDGIDVACNS